MSSGFSAETGMAAYRAHSLFQPHRAQEAIKDAHSGKIPPLMGLYLALSTVPTARLIAPMGFDMVWVDWEHSACGVETMTTMVHEIMFCSEGKTIPFVRVPGHDHAAIGFALDAGASIVIPQIETAEQAKQACSFAKFGTANNGTRSAPPFRLIPGLNDSAYYGKDLHQSLNRQAAIMIQIETLQGIQNLDAILTEVPDIDIVWLGTLDARVSMNLPGNGGMGGPEQEWQDAVQLYEATMAKHDKPKAGFAFGTPELMRTTGTGMSLIVVAVDILALGTMMGQMAVGRDLFPPLGSKIETINGVTTGEKKANRLSVNGKT